MVENNLPANSVHPATRAEWRAWLTANHTRDEGIWQIRYKKAAGKPSVDYDEGWTSVRPVTRKT